MTDFDQVNPPGSCLSLERERGNQGRSMRARGVPAEIFSLSPDPAMSQLRDGHEFTPV
jgi:hypothetical protein